MKSFLKKIEKCLLLILNFLSKIWHSCKALLQTKIQTKITQPVKSISEKTIPSFIFLEPEIKTRSLIKKIQYLLFWVEGKIRKICFLYPKSRLRSNSAISKSGFSYKNIQLALATALFTSRPEKGTDSFFGCFLLKVNGSDLSPSQNKDEKCLANRTMR